MTINIVRGHVGATSKNLVHSPEAIAKDTSVSKESTQTSSAIRNTASSDAVINTVKQKAPKIKSKKEKVLNLKDATSLAEKVSSEVSQNRSQAGFAHRLSNSTKNNLNLGI